MVYRRRDPEPPSLTGDRITLYSAHMRTSVKAALLSGLVFPGLGHLVVRKAGLGVLLIVASLAALSVPGVIAYRQASTVADQIMSGQVPLDETSISEAISASGNETDTLEGNISLAVLAMCWLFGITDSYRHGAALDKQGNP